MSKACTNAIKTCEKCLEKVRLYMVCFKCDLSYHPNCWRKLPGAYLNEKGHAFCCWNITVKQDVSDEDLQMQEHVEDTIEEEEFSGNCKLRDEDLQKIQKLSKKRLYLKINEAERRNSYFSRCILVKQGGEQKKYKCADCNYITNSKVLLEQHIRVHTNERPFKCTYKNCECAAGQEESCKCSMCEYAAAQRGALRVHILTKHTAEAETYKCTDCNYTTYLKHILKRHVRTHTNDKPYKCTYKSCKCTAGQKEFCKCSVCGYAAAQKGTLNTHILRIHNIEPRKYKCANCNYATYDKVPLEQHMRLHTDEKPYKCTYKNCECAAGQEEFCGCAMCIYATTRKSNLKTHILRKHSGKPNKYKIASRPLT